MNAQPPKISPPSLGFANLRFAALVLGLALVGVLAMVYFFNPSAYGFYPVCQFHRLTGLNCPGCGSTRAVYALLHGQFALAARDNVLLVAALIAGAGRGAWFGLNWLRGQPNGNFVPTRLYLPLLVVVLTFGVIRNLPGFEFLSP